jgi:hypothetical protein
VSEIEELFSGDIAGITEQDLNEFDASRAEVDRIESARAPERRLDAGLLDPDAPSEAPPEERRTREKE